MCTLIFQNPNQNAFRKLFVGKALMSLCLFLCLVSQASGQVPTIASFSPTSGTVGTIVTITGTNFDATPANNVVYFGAVKATVSASTATTSLTVTVPVGATHSPITVLNTSSGLLAQSYANFNPIFSPNKGTITSVDFAPKVSFTSGTNPSAMSISDVDGDGKADLVVTNNTSNTLSVFLNNSVSGTVSFEPKLDFATSTPNAVAMGDIDGDGKPDIIVANTSSNTVSVFRNTSVIGTISFSVAVTFSTATSPFSIAVGDIDGDGRLDLAVPNQSSFNVSVLRNISTIGMIHFAPKVDFTVGLNPSSASIADIDGDGKLDLSVVDYGNKVAVFRNTSTIGAITFATKIDFTANANCPSSFITDIDGDSKSDILLSSITSNNISVLRNISSIGTINFAPKVDFATTGNARYVDAGDIDGDNKVDATVISTDGNVSIFRNISTIGSINFAPKVDIFVFANSASVMVGDIDGDGKPDISTANSVDDKISVLRNAPIFVPTITSFSPTSGTVGSTVTITGTNFDTTPANNIVYFGAVKATVSASTATTSLTVTVPVGATSVTPITMINTTSGLQANSLITSTTPQFTVTNSPTITPNYTKMDFIVGGLPNSIVTGDFNNDGKVDFATTNESSDNVNIRLGNGLGNFTSVSDVTVGSEPRSIAIGDFNGDRKVDFAVANENSNTVSIRIGDGLGGFSSNTDIAVGTFPRSIAFSDFNGDGKLDFVTANQNSNNVSVRLGNGLGGFSGNTNISTDAGAYSVAIGDLNADGKADLVVTNIFSNTVSICIGDGLGSFTGSTNISVGAAPFSVALADFNEDGNLDFATANRDSNNVSICLGNGLGNFSSNTTIIVGDVPKSIGVGDFNGDGKIDFVTSNKVSNNVSIRLGDGLGSFFGNTQIVAGFDTEAVCVGDFNNDGKADLATVNNTIGSVSIFLNNSIPLPITLTNFTAERTHDKDITLHWVTASEQQNKGFEIERSQNGVQFEKIAYKEGTGNSTLPTQYTYIDTNAPQSYYYRLKQIDHNGTFTYSPIVFVAGKENILQIYPNPAQDRLHLLWNIDTNTLITINIYQTQGTNVWQYKGTVGNAQQALDKVFPTWQNGTYILQIILPTQVIETKFIKSN